MMEANSTSRRTAAEPDDQIARPAAAFTHRVFRDALGLSPTGVAIVTTRLGNSRKSGLTVNSFTL